MLLEEAPLITACDRQQTNHDFKTWEGAATFSFSLFFYYLSLAKTVIWGDSASFALMVKNFYLDPASDGHPLYVVIGQLFKKLPWEAAVNLNIMSAFFASLTVTLSYLIVRRLTASRLSAVSAAASLLVAHSFWAYAVVAEVYTLNAFILLLIIYLLLAWSYNPENNSLLYAGSFIFGLGITNHMILALAGIAVLFMLGAYRPRLFLEGKPLIKILACFAIGSSLYWGLLIHWYFAYPAKTAQIIDIV
ncbi:MAG: protein O-mannosyl-transferase family, partial [bacterium]